MKNQFNSPRERSRWSVFWRRWVSLSQGKLAKGMARFVARPQTLKKFLRRLNVENKLTRSRWLVPGAALAGVVLLGVPNIASAQRSVPLLEITSASDSGDDAGSGVESHAKGHSTGLIYVNPSEISYPQVVQGMTIAGPSGPDIQVNDPSLDNIQYPVASDPYPWEFATESEASLATDGTNIVVGYNSSANRQIVKFTGNQQSANGHFTYWFTAGYSVSHDGGQSWKSGFIPPPPGSIATWYDPVVAKDRVGNFYYSTQGQDAAGNYGLILASSTNHGDTFAPAVMVALDPSADKPWMTVGPDPNVPSRDNIYVTWTSGGSTSLMFSRSTDGGASWSAAKTIFSYTNDGVLSGFVQASTPTIDSSNGRLYVAFLQFGSSGTLPDFFRVKDYVRLLASDDGGNTFYPVAFNVVGAPNPFVYPKVPAGFRCDQGEGSSGLAVIKQGPDIGGGILTKQYGIPRYVRCSRILGQPVAVAQNGRVVIAFEASTSATYGDPASQSQIVALYSKNGGNIWFPPFVVAAASGSDPQHIIPALALTPDANALYAAYYVQDSNEQVRTELAAVQLTGGGLLAMGRKPLSSVRFDLEPNNFPSPFPPLKSLDTISFDRSVVTGYALGEYLGVAVDPNGNPMAAWGDSRNSWISPDNGLYPGIHPQTDVFFVRP